MQMAVDETEILPLVVAQVPQTASRWYSAVGLSWNVAERATVSEGYCDAYWPSPVLLIKAAFFSPFWILALNF